VVLEVERGAVLEVERSFMLRPAIIPWILVGLLGCGSAERPRTVSVKAGPTRPEPARTAPETAPRRIATH
jgi:hypothetical protein